jgi:methionyl-tRNA synthetase
MSKSLGNVVDPVASMDAYGVDGFRYFLLKEGRLADDGGARHTHVSVCCVRQCIHR